METTRLHLIRHGSTVVSGEDRFAGASDVELSDEGRSQAARLAGRMSDLKLAAVYTSPLARCVETARILADPHGLSPRLRDALREIHHGHWEGLRRSEVEARFSEEYATWQTDPFGFAPRDGSNGASVVARALPAIREIVRAHPGREVAAVSHKATLRLLVAVLLGADPRRYRDRFALSAGARSVLDFRDPEHARLHLFNDVCHQAGPDSR